MKIGVLVSALIAALALPLAPVADTSASEETRLQMEMKRKRTVVLPRPATEQAVTDAERVEADLRDRQRLDEVIRQLTRGRERRPDLDYDVRSAIQARSIRDARRR